MLAHHGPSSFFSSSPLSFSLFLAAAGQEMTWTLSELLIVESKEDWGRQACGGEREMMRKKERGREGGGLTHLDCNHWLFFYIRDQKKSCREALHWIQDAFILLHPSFSPFLSLYASVHRAISKLTKTNNSFMLLSQTNTKGVCTYNIVHISICGWLLNVIWCRCVTM